MSSDAGSINLWLGPPDGSEAAIAFEEYIRELTRASDPPTVSFKPHVTLLSSSVIGTSLSLEAIVAKVEEAITAAKVDCVTCKFDKVEAGELFYQCVYVKLNKAGSQGLLSLHQALRRAFGDTQDPDGISYFPHMSLVYGDIPMDQRKTIVKNMRQIRKVETRHDGQDSVLKYSALEARELWIVQTKGSSDRWKIVAKVPLQRDSDEI